MTDGARVLDDLAMMRFLSQIGNQQRPLSVRDGRLPSSTTIDKCIPTSCSTPMLLLGVRSLRIARHPWVLRSPTRRFPNAATPGCEHCAAERMQEDAVELAHEGTDIHVVVDHLNKTV